MSWAFLRRFPSTSAAVVLALTVFLVTVFTHVNLFSLPGFDIIGIEQTELGEVAIALLFVIPAFLVDRAANIERRHDIRVQAERALAHEESSRLAAIVESSDDAIVSTDLNDLVSTWNLGAERLFGYTAGEMIGTSATRLIPEDRRTEEAVVLRAVSHGGGARNLETVRRAKDGRRVDVAVTLSPIKNASGELIGESRVARDISERKAADAALRRERDRAQQYLDTAGVILLALDLEGRITLVNRHACSVFGWTAEELQGRDFIETCVPPAIRHQTRERLRTVQRGDESLIENPIVTRSGDERLIEWRTVFPRDAEGLITGTLSSGTDITERRRAELAVRDERDRAQQYLDTAEVMLLALDLDGRVTLINRKGCETLGWTEDELRGRSWVDTCLPPSVRPLLRQKFTELVAGDVSVVENPVLTKNGRERLIEWRNRLVCDETGGPVGTFSSGTDITERRMLELQFQQAQKMEAVGRLAGGVAHDFNNLLTAISGYAELVLDELGPDAPHRTEILEIAKAGERAAGLTRQLLAFSRKQIIEPTLLDLNATVTGMRAMLERLIGEDVSVKLSLAPEVDRVIADCGQIEQIILNLVVNARDAMPTGGAVTIETANIELDEHYASTHFAVSPGHYVALIVTDTGSGISPEVQARLFEPFFTTKEQGKGTGLGLATVHGIVARSGGTVGVYSELGRGTSFRVYLPRADANSVVVEKPPTMRSHAGTQTVLVVEDAEGIRTLTKIMLERQGYTVLVAANATEAVQLFEQHSSVDVLLTDVVMPGASGPELTRQLIERRPTLRVIYMSGYTEDAIVHHGVLQHGIAFLNKPFTAATLTTKIQEVLGQ